MLWVLVMTLVWSVSVLPLAQGMAVLGWGSLAPLVGAVAFVAGWAWVMSHVLVLVSSSVRKEN